MSSLEQGNQVKVDLTLFGCPLHYIKARDALGRINLETSIFFKVNNGEALDDLLNSLKKDGHECQVISAETLTTIIKVVKKNV
jgi:TusA-related sulfurtransferase